MNKKDIREMVDLCNRLAALVDVHKVARWGSRPNNVPYIHVSRRIFEALFPVDSDGELWEWRFREYSEDYPWETVVTLDGVEIFALVHAKDRCVFCGEFLWGWKTIVKGVCDSCYSAETNTGEIFEEDDYEPVHDSIERHSPEWRKEEE